MEKKILMNDLTYIIPVYGKPGLLTSCLSTLRKWNGSTPVLVINDHGPDGIEIDSICRAYGARCINRITNGGFSAAVNTGIKYSATKYICLVNSDIEFTRPTTGLIQENFNNDPDTAIIGDFFFYPNGRIEHGGGYYNYFGVRHYGDGKKLYKAKLCSIKAYRFFLTGALMGIRKESWENLGGFNEVYVNDSEDADFCVRAWQKGLKILYDPELTAVHGKSLTLNDPSQIGKDKERWVKRMESNKTFRDFLKTVDVEKIEDEINRLNMNLHPTLPNAFIRTNALGDVLRSLRLYREIKQKMVIVTNSPDVFRNETVEAITHERDEYAVAAMIDLVLTYERRLLAFY